MTDLSILLSPPHLGELEKKYVLEAIESNWIAPAGPDLALFEEGVAGYVGRAHGVALSSGTAALHLALHANGIGPGDLVVVPTLTFAATANAVLYTGARPVLVDCDPLTWTIDPEAVSDLLRHGHEGGRVRAVVPVDLYGQCADYPRLLEAWGDSDALLVEDAAEGLGGTCAGRPSGSFGLAAALSFNGNKMLTTSGGGMLVTDDRALADRVRYLSTQARQPVPHYEHHEIGFNYRLSNVLAALGRGQLAVLDERVAARQATNARYRELLGGVAGLRFMPRASYGEPSWWLTCLLVDPALFGATRDDVRQHLATLGIEARPTWKPLHLQQAYRHEAAVGGGHAEHVFDQGLCLPSGSALTGAQLEQVVEGLLSTPRRALVGAGRGHATG
ncbi:MAG TPA: aminotransferase class I/II-fold pyridoxal phosphate-dependent enzyme [Mycobacteriales bacterium]|nr:aminotransferase class I/II-fold pyridoxal phosphate-dependent enzyme [Mycobacteriales bacterium]